MNDISRPRSVIWSARSRRDLEGIHDYIAVMAPLNARRFTARLIAAVESLSVQPDRGRPVGRVRELVAISPYVISYRVTSTSVEIVRIRHGALRRA